MTGRVGDELPPGPGRDLVDLFARLRAGKDRSNRQIARHAGLSPSYLSEVFNGRKTPRPPVAARIATTLRGEEADIMRARVLAERQGELNQYQRRHAAAETSTAPVAVASTAAVVVTPISGLPRTDPYFTGRDRELRLLTDALTGGYSVCTIYGMAGSGKTTLAVRAAAILADRYPDGVVFLDLHGVAQYHLALTASEAVDRLLRRMHVTGPVIPADVDERVALYRDLLSRRRLLLLLDDAHDSDQVRSLLPESGGSAVVVTSRRRLAGLDDAMVVPIDLLAPNEAVALFRKVVGADRACHEDGADESVHLIVHLCGGLPLAVRIAAGRLKAREHGSLADLAARLADEDERLAELDDDDRSVAASLQVSVNDLPSALTRTFALLAEHPGNDVDPLATSALVDLPRTQAVRHLTQLAARHLIVEHAPDRFQFHDLVRVFGRDHARRTVAAAERTSGLQRLADYYLRAAEAADLLITPQRYRIPLDTLDRTTTVPRLTGYDDALAWFRAEEANIAAICIATGAAGLDVVCWQLAYTLRGYFFLTKSREAWTATHIAARAAAHRTGDGRAEAMTLNNLGMALAEVGQIDAAAGHYQHAQEMFAAVNDEHGVYTARANLAWLRYQQRLFGEFLRQMRPVLAFYRRSGADRNAAITARGMGLAEAELGRFAESVDHLQQALDAFTSMGARMDIAMSWNALGETHQRADDSERARSAFAEGLAASTQCGSDYELARAHHRLGQLAAAAGDWATATAHWAAALPRYERLGAPQAAEVRRALDDLV